MGRPKIKIYGERHTGTKYLLLLIMLNLRAEVIPGGEDITRWYFKTIPERTWLYEMMSDLYFANNFSQTLGWKHTLIPAPAAYLKTGLDLDQTSFLTITKNPYSWLLSLYRNPWHARTKYSSFEEFLTTPWKTRARENAPRQFSSPVDLWNCKNAAYLQLKSYNWKTINLTYENLVDNPEAWINQIAQAGGIFKKKEVFENRETTTTKYAPDKTYTDYKEYYLQEYWKEGLNRRHIEIINAQLNDHILAQFGYSKLKG